MPYASEEARDLVGKLVAYESGSRLSAREVRSTALIRKIHFANRHVGNETPVPLQHAELRVGGDGFFSYQTQHVFTRTKEKKLHRKLQLPKEMYSKPPPCTVSSSLM